MKKEIFKNDIPKNPEYQELYPEAETDAEAADRLFRIVRILRQKCPWDSVQTHQSLRGCMIEEAYEAVDAINRTDIDNLREELGDVMLQSVLNGIIAEDREEFTLADVINEECEKMIRRHPHIFSEYENKPIDKVLEKWENVKSEEHSNTCYSDRLKDVPQALPAILRASKVQKRSAQAVADMTREEALTVMEKDFRSFQEILGRTDCGQAGEKLGDLLFSIVNVARILGINAEEELNTSTSRFVSGFDRVEKSIDDRKEDIRSLTLKDLNDWIR